MLCQLGLYMDKAILKMALLCQGSEIDVSFESKYIKKIPIVEEF